MTHTQLKMRLLGRLEWCYANVGQPELEPPRPATTKAQSLLAYLVVYQRKQHARERLMEMFWGNRSERKARRSLSTALWHIRRCLPGEDYIFSDGQTVGFDFPGEVWLDTEQFEVLAGQRNISSMQAAVELYRGEFMDGFYDDWIINERYRLENLYIDVLAQLIDAYEVSGDHVTALEIALRLLQIDSLREDAHRAAMRAHCRLGRRHDALAQYERCQTVMREELDVEPMAETTDLARAIVDGRFEVAAQPFVIHSPPKAFIRSGTGRNPLDVVSAIPLVGRERELAFLAENWQLGRDGGCSLLLVRGEAGVGKTRLVQEFSAPLQWQGARILQGRCYEFEGVLPYQPVAEALKSLSPALAAGVAAELPGWVSAQVARLAPDLFAATPKGAALKTGGEQTQLFEGVARFLAGLATQESVLLVFEDLHWATDSTLQLLYYLARHLTDLPLLIVGTLRPEAMSPAHTLATLGRRLERERMARRMQLHPLSAAAVEALIAQLAGDGESVRPLARRLYRETEGNPFYLIEMIKMLFEQDAIHLEAGVWQGDFVALSQANLPLPSGVEETIQARVERLREDTREAVRFAAVVGKEFDFDLLNAAWGQGRDATLEVVDELLRKRLIGDGVGEANADYLFTHHKIQEVVYQDLPRRRRQSLHGQVGAALEQLNEAENGARIGELAFHFEQARQLDGGLTEKAISYLQQAGQQAMRQSANQEAIAYYRRGLDILHALPETSQRLQQEIDLQLALAMPTTVIHGYASPVTKRVFDRAVELCRELGETPALFISLVGLARHFGLAGNLDEGTRVSAQLISYAEKAQDDALMTEGCRNMGGCIFCQGRLKEALAVMERGIDLYDPAQHERYAYRFGHDPIVPLMGLSSIALWLQGKPDQAWGRSQALGKSVESMSHPTSQGYALGLMAMHAYLRHDVQGARDRAERAIGLGEERYLPIAKAMATPLRGWALAEQGATEEGIADLVGGTTAWRTPGNEHFSPFFLALQAETFLQAGKPAEGITALATAQTIVRNGGDRYWQAELYRLNGELLRAQNGDDVRAEACFEQAIYAANQQQSKSLALRAAMSLARLWHSQGKNQQARLMIVDIYNQFDEGFETHDLRAAQAMLQALD